MNTKHLSIVAAAVAFVSTSVIADSVDVDYLHTGLGRNVSLHLNDSTTNVFAGQL